jgi:hypothetical protein
MRIRQSTEETRGLPASPAQIDFVADVARERIAETEGVSAVRGEFAAFLLAATIHFLRRHHR